MDLTRDEMYKLYLRQTLGPNTFPFTKLILAMVVYFLILILVFVNMYIVTADDQQTKDVPIMPKLPEPIVTIESNT